MRYRKQCLHDVSGPLGSDAWFISFGDLLTLLLCFFLLLTPHVVHSAHQDEPNQRVSTAEVSRRIVGTDLASSSEVKKGVVTHAIPVWLDSLRSDGVAEQGSQESEVWLRELRNHLMAGGDVSVALCGDDFNRQVVSHVVGELRGIEKLAHGVRFEVAAECETWRARFDSQRRLVGALLFSWS